MKSEVLNKEIEFGTKHIGLELDESLWQFDKWIVRVGGEMFTYRTGVGHRKPKIGRDNKRTLAKLLNTQWKKERENLSRINTKIAECSVAVHPSVDDVLYSLAMESDACEMSFHDWCGNFGYDTDSRSALDTYLACQENGRKLEKAGINLCEAREAFAEY